MWIIVLLGCKPACEDLDIGECIRREDCARSQPIEWCSHDRVYGGCMTKRNGCGDSFTASFLFEGECLTYEHACWPEGLEPCINECDTRYDTGTQ